MGQIYNANWQPTITEGLRLAKLLNATLEQKKKRSEDLAQSIKLSRAEASELLKARLGRSIEWKTVDRIAAFTLRVKEWQGDRLILDPTKTYRYRVELFLWVLRADLPILAKDVDQNGMEVEEKIEKEGVDDRSEVEVF